MTWTSVQYDDCHLKMFVIEANVSISVEHTVAECAALLGGRAELPGKAEKYELQGPHQLAA